MNLSQLPPTNPILLFDRELFERINLDWTSDFADQFFPAITDLHKNHYAQIVFALLIAFWVFKRRVGALKWLLVLVVAVFLSDTIAYRGIKHLVDRPRPEFASLHVNLRTPSHSGNSFPSNHAANNFAAATVLSFAFPAGSPAFFLVAALVAYSRVYCGVHFPLDVLGGALLGTLIGFAVYVLLRKRLKLRT